MAKLGKEILRVKEKYGLEDLDDNLYNLGYQINNLQENLHTELMKEGEITNELNRLNIGIRLQETLIRKYLDDDDKTYINVLREELRTTPNNNIDHKFDILFDRYDLVIDRLNEGLTLKSYYAEENNQGGILSTTIANRIGLQDQNFILSLHGLPRSGKSKGAVRLDLNIIQKTSLILNNPLLRKFTAADWVYDKEQHLKRLDAREKEETVKGSCMVLEESGDQLNSARFWDVEVQGSVNTLQQQGYQNTCLIIISQLFTDVVKKARGLVHCTLVPWKELKKRSIEVDERQHIDFQKKISYWKVDLADVDPMTGERFPQGIKVALGKVKKLGLLYPPPNIVKEIDAQDHEYKRNRQHNQLRQTIAAKLKDGDITKIDEIALMIKDDKTFRNRLGNINKIRVCRVFGASRDNADKIADKVKEHEEKQKEARDDTEGQNKSMDKKQT